MLAFLKEDRSLKITVPLPMTKKVPHLNPQGYRDTVKLGQNFDDKKSKKLGQRPTPHGH